MYEGTNAKALQSQHWLADALVRLMQTQPYGKISIQDICREADLSRQTFYNVFNSKDEMLHFYLRNACEAQVRLLMEEEDLTIAGVVNCFIAVIEENRALLHRMTENQLNGIISAEITNAIRLFAGRLVRREEQDAAFPYSEAMLAGALSGLLLFWLEQEEPIDTQQLTDLLCRFLSGDLYSFPAQ